MDASRCAARSGLRCGTRTDREVVIARVTARTGCGAYEWRVHAATLAQQAGLGPEQPRATTETHAPVPAAWLPRHVALLDAVDEPHDTDQLQQPTWDALSIHDEDARLLELVVLTGWYRTISCLPQVRGRRGYFIQPASFRP